MSKFTLTIELGNDAMQTEGDVKDAVSRGLVSGDWSTLSVGDKGSLKDVNGNTVGEWSVTA